VARKRIDQEWEVSIPNFKKWNPTRVGKPSIYVSVSTSFFRDSKVQKLTLSEKIIFLYALLQMGTDGTPTVLLSGTGMRSAGVRNSTDVVPAILTLERLQLLIVENRSSKEVRKEVEVGGPPTSEELESRNTLPKEEVKEFLEPKKIFSSIQKPKAINATEKLESRFSDFHKKFVEEMFPLVPDRVFLQSIAAETREAFQDDFDVYKFWFSGFSFGKARNLEGGERAQYFKVSLRSEIKLRRETLQEQTQFREIQAGP